ncbi:barstar (barnase inhibitor) [Luteimonas cucumeris]|uniref:Barstar (Barnase inhibitor) n=1 Tax=Luteimonas cucumeris TaxID=985012 RepID=A0A562LA60_9GAMM|nr:barstar family protein [Luteimonas cucumeris]TWI04562.1 barstar (barnase inhibitor) [Luteimonas cucumeris]
MSESGFDLGLSDPARAGVFLVAADDLTTLDVLARDAGLRAWRIDLSTCRNKATLLLRIATMLEFPGSFGRNWDALSDGLRDLGWLPAAGYALLFEGAGDLRDADAASFDTLLDILGEASREWASRKVAFWAFMALPEDSFQATL